MRCYSNVDHAPHTRAGMTKFLSSRSAFKVWGTPLFSRTRRRGVDRERAGDRSDERTQKRHIGYFRLPDSQNAAYNQ